jgi:hypothetical protein
MQFGDTDATIDQTNRCDAFQFSPPARTVSFSQKWQNADLVADGDYFNLGNLANDLEVHQKPLYLSHTQS